MTKSTEEPREVLDIDDTVVHTPRSYRMDGRSINRKGRLMVYTADPYEDRSMYRLTASYLDAMYDIDRQRMFRREVLPYAIALLRLQY